MIKDWIICNWLQGYDLYKYKMIMAINIARKPNSYDGNKESMTNGLRVIRRFEIVNNIDFDPFDKTHLSMIYGNAVHESFFRSLNKITHSRY